MKLPSEVVGRVDRLVKWVRAHVPSAALGSVSRASIVRTALERGIESLENEYVRRVPIVSASRLYRLRASRDGAHVRWYLKAVLDAHVNSPRPLDPERITFLINSSDAFIDLDGTEVQRLFAWASAIEGWPAVGPKPLYVEPLEM